MIPTCTSRIVDGIVWKPRFLLHDLKLFLQRSFRLGRKVKNSQARSGHQRGILHLEHLECSQ